jgi:hypothetical protein
LSQKKTKLEGLKIMKLRSSRIVGAPVFVQKFVWRGTLIQHTEAADAEKLFADTFGVSVCYLGSITTDGGRVDAVFSLHPEHVTKFAVARFKWGSETPSWWEDYLANTAVSERDLNRF